MVSEYYIKKKKDLDFNSIWYNKWVEELEKCLHEELRKEHDVEKEESRLIWKLAKHLSEGDFIKMENHYVRMTNFVKVIKLNEN